MKKKKGEDEEKYLEDCEEKEEKAEKEEGNQEVKSKKEKFLLLKMKKEKRSSRSGVSPPPLTHFQCDVRPVDPVVRDVEVERRRLLDAG